MSMQLTLEEDFRKYAKTTRRSQFLSEMERVVPWVKLCALVAPVYPLAGNGRPPRSLEVGDLLQGAETQVWGAGAYEGQTEVIRTVAPNARDLTYRRGRHRLFGFFKTR